MLTFNQATNNTAVFTRSSSQCALFYLIDVPNAYWLDLAEECLRIITTMHISVEDIQRKNVVYLQRVEAARRC